MVKIEGSFGAARNAAPPPPPGGPPGVEDEPTPPPPPPSHTAIVKIEGSFGAARNAAPNAGVGAGATVQGAWEEGGQWYLHGQARERFEFFFYVCGNGWG